MICKRVGYPLHEAPPPAGSCGGLSEMDTLQRWERAQTVSRSGHNWLGLPESECMPTSGKS